MALKPIDDSDHIFIPPGCKVEQVANFYNFNKVFIVSDIYNMFSELDKLALILHETIYFHERNNGVTNSRYARRVTAHLLSSGFKAEPITEGLDWFTDFYCSTNQYDELPSDRPTNFFAKEIRPGRWKLQFTQINGHQIYSQKSIEFDFNPQGAERLIHFPFLDRRARGDFEKAYFPGVLTSLIDDVEMVTIVFRGDQYNGELPPMMIEWTGFDPGDKVDGQKFSCGKLFTGPGGTE